jgi:hypothetical protein
MNQKKNGPEFNVALPLTFSLNEEQATDTEHATQHDPLPFQLIMCERKVC